MGVRAQLRPLLGFRCQVSESLAYNQRSTTQW